MLFTPEGFLSRMEKGRKPRKTKRKRGWRDAQQEAQQEKVKEIKQKTWSK